MEFYTLASSSAGNAALVCHNDTHLLIDAGISCRRITQSLAVLDLTLDDLRSFRTSHDAKESVGYRIESDAGSLAVLTDTGFVTDEAHDAALGADMLLLESNHDVVMLKNGGYPYYLKQRILSEYGHLSNDAAAEFAIECVRAGTSDILLAHLSDENNSPQLAEYTVGRALQSSGLSVRLAAAPRDTISEVHVCRRSPSFASEN